jgi:hypothetical protein
MTFATAERAWPDITRALHADPSEISDGISGDTDVMHPDLTHDDIDYVTATFRELSAADQQAAAAGLAPQPSYLLPSGRAMGPARPDPELAGASDASDLRRRFRTRWVAAGGQAQDADSEFAAWLGGGYGVCLRSPAPETILAKTALAQAITALIARPLPDQHWWQATLRSAVEAFDQLVLPFASVDAERFGRPTTRTRLIDTVRERWPEVFAHANLGALSQGHGS